MHRCFAVVQGCLAGQVQRGVHAAQVGDCRKGVLFHVVHYNFAKAHCAEPVADCRKAVRVLCEAHYNFEKAHCAAPVVDCRKAVLFLCAAHYSFVKGHCAEWEGHHDGRLDALAGAYR